jgi:hypothetical protein
MSLEEEIDRLIESYNGQLSSGVFFVPINHWKLDDVRATFSTMKEFIFKQTIYKIIEEAPLILCLTSPHPFIRDYRKLYEDQVKINANEVLSNLTKD